ncbi:MAG: patatin-like phospholipase family protein [Desulfobacterales bacterium]|jgi:NTE family protein|nr:patatin-like phospholipase family protein [Desulfobacterales bacterium]
MTKALVLSGGGARGAFQVGVMKYLKEIGWEPDLVCGTSVGAVNAAAYGSGMSVEKMIDVWKTYQRKNMFRITLPILFKSLNSRHRFSPMSDIRKLKKLIIDQIDIQKLKNSSAEIIITAINMTTGQIRYFTHHAIGIEHLMAASAIPGLFPWQIIDNEPHWDAGLMINTPIAPAFQRGATEIITVLHSPVGAFRQQAPRTPMEVAELVFEHFLIGSYVASLPDVSWQVNPNAEIFETPMPGSPQLQLSRMDTKIINIAPTRMLGFRSLLNFSIQQAQTLIEEGYNNARIQLQYFLKSRK